MILFYFDPERGHGRIDPTRLQNAIGNNLLAYAQGLQNAYRAPPEPRGTPITLTPGMRRHLWTIRAIRRLARWVR